jgi:hypothetical protein
MTIFETETMAELCVKQGLVTEALAIYRRLVDAAPDAPTRARRAGRLAELERVARGAAAVRAPEAAVPSARADETPALTLERRGDALVVTWAVPAETRAPALQLLLVRRGAEDIETETRTVPLGAVRGTTTIDAPGLHSVRAAVGWIEDARFVPLARLPPSSP